MHFSRTDNLHLEVDHDWYTGNIRLTGNQAENAPSPLRRRASSSHIDINNLRAAFYLRGRHPALRCISLLLIRR